jgi:predicted metal-dependent phosphoesterase TrpH
MAVELQKTLGEKIIVGEEIMTSEGELIGLFLTKIVNAGMTAEATAKAIKAQNGLVYVPHPFETVRKGVSLETLDQIADLVDIMEVNNGRALLQNHGPAAAKWARLSNTAGVASSDAHGYKGLGTTYTILKELPSCENLMSLLPMARMIASRPPLKTLLYPKANRLRKLLIKR